MELVLQAQLVYTEDSDDCWHIPALVFNGPMQLSKALTGDVGTLARERRGEQGWDTHVEVQQESESCRAMTGAFVIRGSRALATL
jgi:hypothetical protein